jgi:DNA polymerase III subunit alpha, Gram-positive type
VAWFKVYYPQYYYATYFTKRCEAFDIVTMIKGERDIYYQLDDLIKRQNDKDPTKKLSNKESKLLDTYKISLEMLLRGYRFGKIDLYRSLANEFMVDPDNEKIIIPPFSCIDSLGINVAESIVAARSEREFMSKEDLLRRTLLNKTLMDKLTAMGCLNSLQEENQLSLF